jgi:tripartite ATP-independent transporter DctP family solute receptor
MKRTKVLVLAIAATIVTVGNLFAGGGGESGGAPASTKAIKMKLATVGNPGDGIVAGCEFFAKKIEERTNGTITAEVFVSSQLGGYTDYISGLQMDSIQIAEIGASVLSGIAPKFAVFDLPYISSNVAAQQKLMKGEAGEILNKNLSEKGGLTCVGWIIRPARSVYSSKGPITKLADFKGLKIRTMQSAPMLRAMELLGASATPIPTAERYLALQTKVVDAAENNLVEILNAKEYEVTKYLSLTEHIIQPTCLCIADNFLDSLPENLRKIVLEVGIEAGDAGTAKDAEIVATARKKLATQGKMIINDLPDKTPYMKAVAPLYQEYRDAIGEDLLAMFQGL